MSFTNQTCRTSAVGSGSTGQEVSFQFPINTSSDLTVLKRVTATGVETTLTETTNYTVSKNADGTGTVTTVTAIETTEEIHVIRDTPNTQETSLTQGGAFNAKNLETALDKLTKLVIENKDKIDRVLKTPETDSAILDMELPNSVDRASKFLTFDANGEPTATTEKTAGTVTFSAFGESLVDDADAAEARDTLGGNVMYDVDKYATFVAAINDIGSTECELHLHSSQHVPTDTTVPATCTLVFHKGGKLRVANGRTVTINGAIKAGIYQVFDLVGTGVVAFGRGYIKEFYPQWWGAVADGSTDDHTDIQAACDGVPLGSTIYFPPGRYKLGKTLVIAEFIKLEGGGYRPQAAAARSTVRLEFAQTDGTNGIECTDAGFSGAGIGIYGIDIIGNASAGHGLYCVAGSAIGHFTFRDMNVERFGGDGFHGEEFYINEFYNCAFKHNAGYGIRLKTANENRFYSCEANSNDGSADVYLDGGRLNFFDVDIGTGTADWALYFTGLAKGNIVRAYDNGTPDRGLFFDVDTMNNEVFYQGATAQSVTDKGINNRILNTLLPGIPTYQHSEHSIPLAKNQVHNGSGVVDAAVGWNSAGGVVHTRVATDGISTGTCHKFAWDAADDDLTAWTNFSDAVVEDDIVVYQFWAKTSRVLTDNEIAQVTLLGSGQAVDMYPQNGWWFDVTNTWRLFTGWGKAEDSVLTNGVALQFKMGGSTGEVLGSAVDLFVTDVALYINPNGAVAQTPFVFSGGTTEHVNYPLSHTGRLEQMLRLPNLDTAPANPEPGAIAMADGMNWDPSSVGTSICYPVMYVQAILVGDDYKWSASGSGTNEYYCELTAGGNPNLTSPSEVRIDGSAATEGTAGSLNAGEWDWGDNDSLGYSTVYVRLTGGGDPDSESDGAVTAMWWKSV